MCIYSHTWLTARWINLTYEEKEYEKQVRQEKNEQKSFHKACKEELI